MKEQSKVRLYRTRTMRPKSTDDRSTDDRSTSSDDSEREESTTEKIKYSKRIASSSSSSSARATPDSLRSGPLNLLHNVMRDAYDDSDSNGCDTTSSSESSCGYPLLTALSRTPSVKSIPETPLAYYTDIKNYKKPQGCLSRPSSAYSTCSKREYSSRASSRYEKPVAEVNDCMQAETVDVMQAQELDQAKISTLLSRRPASAPSQSTKYKAVRPHSCLKNHRTKPKVSFSPLAENKSKSTVHTQTDQSDNEKTLRTANSTVSRNHTSTQTVTNMCDDCKVQCDRPVMISAGGPKRESKSCQTDGKFLKGIGHDIDKYFDVTIAAIAKRERYDKLRASSARTRRSVKSNENMALQRCKSALAIMVTQTRVSSATAIRRTNVTTPTRKAIRRRDPDRSNARSMEIANLSNSSFTLKDKRRQIQPLRKPRACNQLPGYRRKPDQGVNVSRGKLAKLKKAYGNKNVDLSGLTFYTKKLRLPMHGGYKSLSSREVDDIVDRLSSCRLSCGRMHDYNTLDPPPIPKRRHRCHTAPSTRGSSRTMHDESESPMIDEQERLRLRRPKSGLAKSDFGAVISKSLDQIDSSLSRARNVLSNLSGYVSGSSPESRRRRNSSRRSIMDEALVGKPVNIVPNLSENDRRNFTIEKRIQEAWQSERSRTVNPEWIQITKRNSSTTLYPEFHGNSVPFPRTRRHSLPFLRQDFLQRRHPTINLHQKPLKPARHDEALILPVLDIDPNILKPNSFGLDTKF